MNLRFNEGRKQRKRGLGKGKYGPPSRGWLNPLPCVGCCPKTELATRLVPNTGDQVGTSFDFWVFPNPKFGPGGQ